MSESVVFCLCDNILSFDQSVISVGPCRRILRLRFLSLFLLLALFSLFEQTLQLLLLSQDFEKLEDHWHIVVTSTFVL